MSFSPFCSGSLLRRARLAALVALVVGAARAGRRRARHRRHLHGPGLSPGNAGAQCDTGRGTAAGPGQQRAAARPGDRPARPRTALPARAPPAIRTTPSRAAPSRRRRRSRTSSSASSRGRPAGCCRSSGRPSSPTPPTTSVARQRAGLGRLHGRPRRRDRDPRLGLDRRRLPQHRRPQRHAQPAQGGQLQRRRRQGRRPREEPARRRSRGSTPTST